MTLDVRSVPCSVKHGLIFKTWSELPVGGCFVLLNDHDPVPLHERFVAEFGDSFCWDYLERGPSDFRIRIGKMKAVDVSMPQNISCCGESHD